MSTALLSYKGHRYPAEIINHHLAKWCLDNQITFTRGRPSRSNDQAHVEQKNLRFPPKRGGIDNEDCDVREENEVRPGVP